MPFSSAPRGLVTPIEPGVGAAVRGRASPCRPRRARRATASPSAGSTSRSRRPAAACTIATRTRTARPVIRRCCSWSPTASAAGRWPRPRAASSSPTCMRALDGARPDAAAVRRAMLGADRAIASRIAQVTASPGAATVVMCTPINVLASKWLIAWVGDCRAYRLSSRGELRFELLTRDDTFRQLERGAARRRLRPTTRRAWSATAPPPAPTSPCAASARASFWPCAATACTSTSRRPSGGGC